MTGAPSNQGCDVTVALLTRNAGALLGRITAALDGQEAPLRVERLAVDSGSTDGTIALLASAGFRIIRIAPGDFDFGRTRDLAFENARGDVVVSLSQDAVPARPSWLANLVAPLRSPGTAASCGRSIFDPERSYPQFAWERNGYFYFTREIRKFKEKWGTGLSNANSAIRKDAWEGLRFGPQPIGEDFRFQIKLIEKGHAIAFPSDAEVLHHHDYSLATLVRRCRNEGLGLRQMGCPYNAADLLCDLASPRKYRVWLGELLRGNLKTLAALGFPVVRPLAVYAGSRFAREFIG